MTERSIYLRGTNLKLLGASAALAVGTLVLALGPCAAQRTGLRLRQAALELEMSRAQDGLDGFRPIADRERAAWEQTYTGLERWIPAASDEPSVMAALARVFEGGSLRSLEVRSAELSESEPLLPWSELQLKAPSGDRVLALRAMPIRVRFLAAYPDTARILEKLETGAAPVILQRLNVQREAADLRVEAELIFIVRGAPDAG